MLVLCPRCYDEHEHDPAGGLWDDCPSCSYATVTVEAREEWLARRSERPPKVMRPWVGFIVTFLSICGTSAAAFWALKALELMLIE